MAGGRRDNGLAVGTGHALYFGMNTTQQTRTEEGSMKSAYQQCVACSGTLKSVRNVSAVNVQTCQSCGGLHVSARDRKAVLGYVNLDVMYHGDEDLLQTRYFDVTYRTEVGPQRAHGWFDRSTRAMAQVG